MLNTRATLNKIIEFLKEYSELLNNNEFKELYKEFRRSYPDQFNAAGYLTEILYDAGLQPLEYMNFIPENMFYDFKMDKLIIPNNIYLLPDYAFTDFKVKHLFIPKSIKAIEEDAFIDARITNIYYEGRKEELERLISLDYIDCINLYTDQTIEDIPNE